MQPIGLIYCRFVYPGCTKQHGFKPQAMGIKKIPFPVPLVILKRKLKLPVDKRAGINYIYIMKTAVVDIPDDIFETADQIAGKLKLSRSQFYANALEEYIGSHFPNTITEKLNAVYDEKGENSRLDKVYHNAQLNVLESSEW